MSFAFNASRGPIVVEASLSGPAGQADLRLILDTGATTSLIRIARRGGGSVQEGIPMEDSGNERSGVRDRELRPTLVSGRILVISRLGD